MRAAQILPSTAGGKELSFVLLPQVKRSRTKENEHHNPHEKVITMEKKLILIGDFFPNMIPTFCLRLFVVVEEGEKVILPLIVIVSISL